MIINCKHILFVSSCSETWGGSEELWNNLAHHMLKEGYTINLYKDEIDTSHPKLKALANSGVGLYTIKNSLSFILKLIYTILITIKFPFVDSYKSKYLLHKIFRIKGLQRCIENLKPDYVIISQGINYDGMDYAWLCKTKAIPYSIICQKVIETSFLSGERTLKKVRQSYTDAHKVFFVSQHNKIITEEQIIQKLPNSEVVLNPNKFQDIDNIPITDFNTNQVTFLCVGRFYISEKGQDILLRVLSKDKWRKRPFKVYLIGSGMDKQLLLHRISFYNLKSIEIKDYSTNILNEWKHAQGLILPSRHEGLPLVMLEAMSLGKICIIGNAGGSIEVIKDGINGYIGDPTTEGFDAAMERAWENRTQWNTVSTNAIKTIKTLYNNKKPFMTVYNHLTKT